MEREGGGGAGEGERGQEEEREGGGESERDRQYTDRQIQRDRQKTDRQRFSQPNCSRDVNSESKWDPLFGGPVQQATATLLTLSGHNTSERKQASARSKCR